MFTLILGELRKMLGAAHGAGPIGTAYLIDRLLLLLDESITESNRRFQELETRIELLERNPIKGKFRP